MAVRSLKTTMIDAKVNDSPQQGAKIVRVVNNYTTQNSNPVFNANAEGETRTLNPNNRGYWVKKVGVDI